MIVWLNEQIREIAPGTSLRQLRDRFRPDADIVIYNGHAESGNPILCEKDRVVLIRRGERPSADELEALLVARHTPGVHDKIRAACVGIAGVGGLGSPVAMALARCGIGRLIIADCDVVEPSNLNRQNYFLDQIGMYKVEALRQTLERINPYVEVVTHHLRLTPVNIPDLFKDVNVMVEAFDLPDQKAMLVETFLGKVPGTPLVAASGVAGFGPANTIRTRRAGSRLFLVGDETSAARPGEGLMAPRVGVAAHHQANAVLRLLLDQDPAEEQPR
ncbi:MAG: sulfur carrier protein ThiS adenylyltransferase ThiF [Syntrophotaleaceae bacterium]